MSVFKERKKWRAEVYVNGRRIASKSGFLSKKQAKKWHDVTLGTYATKTIESDYFKEYVFEDLIDRFERVHMATIRQGTATRYLIDINYRIRPYFQYYKLNRITIDQIEEFRATLCKEVSHKSVNNCLALLKTIFKKGVTWKMLDVNPAAEVDLLKIAKQKYTWWDNEEDVRSFLETARGDRYYLAYRLALDLGMRLGEIIGLSKADVNLNRCQVHIHRQWLEKERRYGPTKQNRERFVTYAEDSDLGEVLRRAIADSPHKEALIVASTGARLGARKLSGYHFKRMIEKAGVPDIRFHDLRHTFASWFMIKNDDIWALKGILGHADVQTTQRYAHLSSRFQKVPSFGWGGE